MKKLLIYTVVLFLTTPLFANQKVDKALAEFAWQKRQLVVFAPSLDHPEYKLFLELEKEFKEDFIDRKMHVWHIIAGQQVMLQAQSRTDLQNCAFRETFKVDETAFKLLLIGYDQQEKLRYDKVQIDDLFGEIDQMPMRMQEMRENR